MLVELTSEDAEFSPVTSSVANDGMCTKHFDFGTGFYMAALRNYGETARFAMCTLTAANTDCLTYILPNLFNWPAQAAMIGAPTLYAWQLVV